MAEERPVTPEKQLLNLIEKPKADKSLHAASIKYQGLSFLSLGAFKGRLSFFKGRLRSNRASANAHAFDIKLANQLLKTSILGLGVYFVFNVLVSASAFRKELKLTPSTFNSSADTKIAQLPTILKSISFYLQKPRERDIFKMGAKPVILDQKSSSRGPSQRIIEATGHLKLVGISWSDNPDVMIEDTKGQRTLFLKSGQTVDNNVVLKAVFKEKVILSYGGEEIELR